MPTREEAAPADYNLAGGLRREGAPSRLWINSLLDRRDAIAGAQLP